MLKIAVCIKQIPLIEEANFDATTKTIKRDGPNVISAFDLRAISLAVELKNRHGAETTVVTMGPPQARGVLVDALAMGMDRATHLEDRAFAGAIRSRPRVRSRFGWRAETSISSCWASTPSTRRRGRSVPRSRN